MSEISVRALTEDEWEQYRSVRLAALQESPEAFVATLEEEKQYDEEFWRTRMNRSRRLLAEVDGRAVGGGQRRPRSRRTPPWRSCSACGWSPRRAAPGSPRAWSRPEPTPRAATGSRTWPTGSAPTTAARSRSRAASASRPTDSRRPMRVVSADDGDEEIAMVLALGQDRGVPTL